MSHLPVGTVTFLFTDIEESTRLLSESGTERYATILEDHRRRLRAAFVEHGGVELGTHADALFYAFDRASAALAAAHEGQIALRSAPVRVRMGIHTGEPSIVGGEYVGIDLHRAARIAAVGHGGQILASEQTARLATAADLVDLGLHRLKDLTRPERLYQLNIPELQREFPPLRTLDLHQHNLPPQITPLIGREAAARALVARIGGGSNRLLTLTGPAGTGKTRLALAAAAELVEQFEGVFFIDLAPLSDPQLVCPTIARTIGAREEAERAPLTSIRQHLEGRRMLILLDNFEHLLPAASQIGELISTVPRVTVIVTSRIPLRLRGEQEFPVPPLELPHDESWSTPEGLARCESVRLFLERAAAVRPDFRLSADNSQAVAEICRRLDGLPLAIELAAARIRILMPEAMLARLTSRLRLLTVGPRDVPSRQQTLRGAIDWSHELLNDDEMAVFRRLSAFSGGATLEAVEEICGEEGGSLDVLEVVASLAEKSLLRLVDEAAGEPRIAMLETIQEYAREKLVERNEAREISRRHALYFLDLAERASPQLGGPQQVEWLARLEREHDNFRRALRWVIDEGEGELAVRLAGRLQTFWMAHSHLREGSRWLHEALVLSSEQSSAPRARALLGAGALARQQGDLDHAEELVGEGLEISRALHDRPAIARALINLGAVRGERGDPAAARPAFEEALAVLREVGDRRLLAMVLSNLGVTAEVLGDPARAAELYTESLEISQRIGDGAGASLAMSNLGHIAFEKGELGAAAERFRQSLTIARDAGHTYAPIHEVANLALVAAAAGSPRRAARLFAAAETHLHAVGAAHVDVRQAKHDRALGAARLALGEAEWAQEWAKGAAMSLQAAVDYALTAEDPAAAD